MRLAEYLKNEKEIVLTWIHPLHPKGKRLVRDQIISSPSWIRDDCMCAPSHQQPYHGNKSRKPGGHSGDQVESVLRIKELKQLLSISFRVDTSSSRDRMMRRNAESRALK